jgi:hypothetical protein
MRYIYTNHSSHAVFECIASNILEADKLYEQGNADGVLANKIPSWVSTWSPDWWREPEGMNS